MIHNHVPTVSRGQGAVTRTFTRGDDIGYGIGSGPNTGTYTRRERDEHVFAYVTSDVSRRGRYHCMWVRTGVREYRWRVSHVVTDQRQSSMFTRTVYE